MYDMMMIRDRIDVCQEEFTNIKKCSKRRKYTKGELSFNASELNRTLGGIEMIIESNIKEYVDKKDSIQGKMFYKLRCTVIDKKISILEEYQYEVTQIKNELSNYMQKTP